MSIPQSFILVYSILFLSFVQASISEQISSQNDNQEQSTDFPVTNTKHEDICNFENVACMTKGAQIEKTKLNPYIEPMQLRHFALKLPNIQYEMTNSTLKGMANCAVTKLICNNTKLDFDYTLECPGVVLQTRLSGKGSLSPIDFNQEGSLTITTGTYKIRSKGYYDIRTNKNAPTPYEFIFIKVNTVTSETEPVEKLTYKIEKFSYVADYKSNLLNIYLNENWSEMEKILLKPVLQSFMTLYMIVAQSHSASMPLDEIVPKSIEFDKKQ